MKRVTKGKGQDSVGSALLSCQENDRLQDLLGRRCASLWSAVAQLLMAVPHEPLRWTLQHSGLVCFVKDSLQRSFFIRFYDIKAGKLLWEQELYNQLVYTRARPYFHTFPGDNCQIGLNFAETSEADGFISIVNEKIHLRSKHNEKIQRKASDCRDFGVAPPLPPPNGSLTPFMSPMANIQNQMPPTKTKKEKKEKEKKNKKGSKLLKVDIGAPSGFTHVSHFGMRENTLDPDMLKALSRVGISKADMEDSTTSQLIYDVIEQSGGMDAVKIAVNMHFDAQRSPAPPVPVHRGSLPQIPPMSSQGRLGPLPPVPGSVQPGPIPSRTTLPPTPSRAHSGSLPTLSIPEGYGGHPPSQYPGPRPPLPSGGYNEAVQSRSLPVPPGGRSGPLPPPPGARRDSYTRSSERRGSSMAPKPAPAPSIPSRSGPLPPLPTLPRDDGYLPPPPPFKSPLPPPPSDFFDPPPDSFSPPPPPDSFFPPPPEDFIDYGSHRQPSGLPPPPPVSSKANTGGPPPPPPPPAFVPPTPPANFPTMTSSSSEGCGNSSQGSDDAGGRGALLAQIQSGMKLKKVTSSPDVSSVVPETGEGIVGALMMAMHKRSKVIHSSDDEDDEFDEEEDDEEDWD